MGISQYLKRGGVWNIGESRCVWHGSKQVVATRTSYQWFQIQLENMSVLANAFFMDWLKIAESPVYVVH